MRAYVAGSDNGERSAPFYYPRITAPTVGSPLAGIGRFAKRPPGQRVHVADYNVLVTEF